VAQPGGRKEFVSTLAEAVVRELLAAPASGWQPLATAAAHGFNAAEAMAWSTDVDVATALGHHGWDHAFPAATATGDFSFDSEFEFVAKNGRGLRRTFDHHVTIRADGSGQSATTLTIRNSEPPRLFGQANLGDASYTVVYAPGGARLDPSSDSPYYAYEATVNGHPAEGWLMIVDPLATQRLNVVWDVPGLLRPLGRNRWVYDLDWRALPAHGGDVLQLRFTLPPGWRWQGAMPPATVRLTRDFSGSWTLVAP
jgi:hypothetical protein